ncbi:uncharacterized protein LOC116293999 [Actinia tenebrosa]|uniref:Uncharacterized protein LOC116293999 n=1 Tax=Actinia tenebrosa TaxID=6105 RepID=A0A6P8HXQ2_ACTTE|nr:uncharacterized protein LOC116293999 [Actinia tenebrosa]
MAYMRERIGKRICFCTKRCVLLNIIVGLLVLFVGIQIRIDLQEASLFRKVKLVKNSWFERQYVGSWIQNKLLSYKWESYVDTYCKKRKSLAMGKSYTMEDYLQWTQKIGEQLGFQDGHSIFDNGCGCGAFLSAFNLTYKNVKAGGLDLSTGAIKFTREIFPEMKDNFKVGTVEDLSFVQDASYDHSMTFGTFPYVSPEKQCKAVKEMLRIVKPGGSLYIGHNLESDCKDKTHIGIFTLSLCFWNEQCLKDHDDIKEIYYVKERDLFGVSRYCPEKGAVFIHKKGDKAVKVPEHSYSYTCNSKYPPSGRGSLEVTNPVT